MKNSLAALALVLVVALGGYTFTHQTSPKQSPKQGTLAGPDIPYQYLNWGGVYEYHFGFASIATSSVFCAVQNTIGTSSIMSIGLGSVTQNLLGAQAFDISTSSSAVGSSTPALVLGATLPSSASGDVVTWDPGGAVSTTTAGILGTGTSIGSGATKGNNPFIWKLGEWLTYRVASSTLGTIPAGGGLIGNCTVQAQLL